MNKDQKRSKAPLGGSIWFWGLEGKGPEIGFGMEGYNLNWTGEVFSSGKWKTFSKQALLWVEVKKVLQGELMEPGMC